MSISVRHIYHPMVEKERRHLINMGLITLAIEIIENKIQYGVAFCSPKEKLCTEVHENNKKIKVPRNVRKIGAEIATQRIFEEPIEIKCKINSKALVYNVLLDILNKKKYPDWAEFILVYQLTDLGNAMLGDQANHQLARLNKA